MIISGGADIGIPTERHCKDAAGIVGAHDHGVVHGKILVLEHQMNTPTERQSGCLLFFQTTDRINPRPRCIDDRAGAHCHLAGVTRQGRPRLHHKMPLAPNIDGTQIR